MKASTPFLFVLAAVGLAVLGLLLFYLARALQQDRVQQQYDHVLWYFRNHPAGPQADVLDVFDKVVVVAIPARQQYIVDSLSTFGLEPGSYHFVDPVLKDSLAADQLPSGMTAGAVACYQSHLRALQDFLADATAETCLVVEDDLKPCPNADLFQRRLGELQQELSSKAHKWDILFLGRCYDFCSRGVPVSRQLVKGTAPLCTHAYAVTREGAAAIVRESDHFHQPIDQNYRKWVQQGKLQCLTVVPSLFYQNRDSVPTELDHGETLRECKGMRGRNFDYYWKQA